MVLIYPMTFMHFSIRISLNLLAWTPRESRIAVEFKASVKKNTKDFWFHVSCNPFLYSRSLKESCGRVCGVETYFTRILFAIIEENIRKNNKRKIHWWGKLFFDFQRKNCLTFGECLTRYRTQFTWKWNWASRDVWTRICVSEP